MLNESDAFPLLQLNQLYYQVTAQDVSTMIRNGQNTIIFLINNGGYTIEVEIHHGPYTVIKNWNYTVLVAQSTMMKANAGLQR